MRAKIFAGFFIFVLLISSVLALGITPGRTTYIYEPGARKQFSFSILNTGSEDLNLKVVSSGELNASISVSESSFSMAANEKERKVDVDFVMPFGLSPGTHAGEIVVTQASASYYAGSTFLGASAGVATQIYVIVPYPGKYVVASANVVGPDDEGNLLVVIPVINRGEEDIASVKAVVDVYDASGKRVAGFASEEQSLAHLERKELTGILNNNLPVGNYKLSIVIYYDGESMNFERGFSVGEPLIQLKEMKVGDFKLGGIAKFETVVENKWNEEIKGVYSKMRIYDLEGGVLAEFQSAPQDVSASGEAVLVSYWDSTGAEKAVYDAVLSLNYKDKYSEKKFKLDVGENALRVIGVSYVISKGTQASSRDAIVTMLITAIIMLLLINIVWFVMIRKKLFGRER